MWEITTFVLNALLFVLLGLQLPSILDALQGDLDVAAALVGGARERHRHPGQNRLGIPATYLPRRLSARVRARDPSPPWQYPALISWMGLRGAVSLAAALSVPTVTDGGAPFPNRDLVIYLAFAVIIATLVLQGLSLPGVIRLLGLEDDGIADKEEVKARVGAAEGARAARGAERRGVGERGHGRAAARCLRLPPAAVHSAFRQRRRRERRAALTELPAASRRTARRRAAGRPRAPPRRTHQRRGDATPRRDLDLEIARLDIAP